MSNKKVIGLCSSEIDAIHRIEELKVEGYNLEHVYAVTKDADLYLMLQNRTKAEVASAGPSITEKVKSIFTKDKPVREYLLHFGLSEEDADAYFKNVEEEFILLVADQQAEAHYKEVNRTIEEAAAASNGPSAIPLPSKEEAERRKRLQEQGKTTEPHVTDHSIVPPNEQPLHRDFF